MALKKMLLPDLKKELRTHLLDEAKECVLKACCRKLYNWIKVAPLSVDLADEDDDDWDTSKVVITLVQAMKWTKMVLWIKIVFFGEMEFYGISTVSFYSQRDLLVSNMCRAYE